jgi:SLAP domain-containing protein
MEQTLTYHPAWVKQIAKDDMLMIEKMFEEIDFFQEKITFTPIRIAKNYKNHLLVSVIIHNGTDHIEEINNKNIRYVENGSIITEEKFSLPMQLSEKTSIPWTFIFTSPLLNWDEMKMNGELILL